MFRRQNVTRARSVTAINLVRRVRGGSQPHLLDCDDGRQYVVKLLGNPQGPNVLANEWIGTSLARASSLRVPESVFVVITTRFRELNPGMYFECRDGFAYPPYGVHFGSAFLEEDHRAPRMMQYVPRSERKHVVNVADCLGMALLDILIENDDDRQAVFQVIPSTRKLLATFTDFGHAFRGPAGQGFRARQLVRHFTRCPYPWNEKRVAFWIERFQKRLPRAFRQAVDEMPAEWYLGDIAKLQDEFLERLDRFPSFIRSTFFDGSSSSRALTIPELTLPAGLL